MMQRPVTRIPPAGPTSAYKTYSIDAPAPTHFRDASCHEVSCQNHLFGWQTAVDESTSLGLEQAHYIRRLAGRPYQEVKEDGMTTFIFPAGAECFAHHQLRLEREEVFVVRGGDHRGNPRGDVRIHDNPDSWVNDFAEHQDRIDKALNG